MIGLQEGREAAVAVVVTSAPPLAITIFRVAVTTEVVVEVSRKTLEVQPILEVTPLETTMAVAGIIIDAGVVGLVIALEARLRCKKSSSHRVFERRSSLEV